MESNSFCTMVISNIGWWLWQAEFQYQNEYLGISTNIGVPIINFSGVLGNNSLSLGSDISYNPASGNLVDCNAAFSFIISDLAASVI
ncbi:mitochondrial outer membrane protein porin of -like, partial [Thalictrum thalictroides]